MQDFSSVSRTFDGVANILALARCPSRVGRRNDLCIMSIQVPSCRERRCCQLCCGIGGISSIPRGPASTSAGMRCVTLRTCIQFRNLAVSGSLCNQSPRVPDWVMSLQADRTRTLHLLQMVWPHKSFQHGRSMLATVLTASHPMWYCMSYALPLPISLELP